MSKAKKATSTSTVDVEELDFMSDEFITPSTETRPGLLFNSREKREHELRKKRLEANKNNKSKSKKSFVQLQDEQREIKMKEEIDSKNKGFQLLQKMGYKPGMTIGASDGGLKAPLPIEMKRTRVGLGEKTKIEEKKRKMEEWKEELNQLSDPVTYRSRLRELAEIRDIERDLKKAQNSCQTLDTKAGLLCPVMTWYWPKVKKPEADSDDEESFQEEVQDLKEEEEDEDIEPREKLEKLLLYLREKYFYCIWCGTAFDGAEDFRSSCPGPTREDH